MEALLLHYEQRLTAGWQVSRHVQWQYSSTLPATAGESGAIVLMRLSVQGGPEQLPVDSGGFHAGETSNLSACITLVYRCLLASQSYCTQAESQFQGMLAHSF